MKEQTSMNHEEITNSIKEFLSESQNVVFKEQYITGEFYFQKQEQLNLVNSVIEGDSVIIKGAAFHPTNNEPINIGSTLKYQLIVKSTGYHFASYQSYFKHTLTNKDINLSSAVLYEDYYLHSTDSNNSIKQPIINRIIEFIRCLENKFYFNDKEQLVIFAKTYCEIPLMPQRYDEYLNIVDIFEKQSQQFNALKKMIDWLHANSTNITVDEAVKNSLLVHETERYSIIGGEIYDLVITIEDKTERIFKLLKNIENLYQSVLQKYSLYLDDFKYSKFNEKVVKFTNEFLEKINKNVSDLQTQVLALPLASAFLATFKPNTTLNWVVFLAFLVYCLMVLYSSMQQAYNLVILEKQINNFPTENKIPDSLIDKWKTEIKSVRNKIFFQKVYFVVIEILILFIGLVCFSNLI